MKTTIEQRSTKVRDAYHCQHLTEEQVTKILRLRKEYQLTYKVLAIRFEVSMQLIREVCLGKRCYSRSKSEKVA